MTFTGSAVSSSGSTVGTLVSTGAAVSLPQAASASVMSSASASAVTIRNVLFFILFSFLSILWHGSKKAMPEGMAQPPAGRGKTLAIAFHLKF